MKGHSKTPRKFPWRITTESRLTPGTVSFQEQCSCGSGGGNQCQSQCGGGGKGGGGKGGGGKGK